MTGSIRIEAKEEKLSPWNIRVTSSIASYILKEMGTREVYDYKQIKGVPYISDPDKWYQHLLQHLLDLFDDLVQPVYVGRYIVGVTHRLTEMARSGIKKECEMAESKTFVPPGRRQNVYRSITEDYF